MQEGDGLLHNDSYTIPLLSEGIKKRLRVHY